MMWNYFQQKSNWSYNAKRLPVSFTTCLITALVLLSTNLVFSTFEPNFSREGGKPMQHGLGLVPANLSLPLEKANMYVEEKLGIRHSGWMAGPAKSFP